MEGLPWQSIVTLMACLVSCVVVPLVVWGAMIWGKVGRLEVSLAGLTEWLRKVEMATHPCPYIQIRTEHHEAIAQHERRILDLEVWRREIDRRVARWNAGQVKREEEL